MKRFSFALAFAAVCGFTGALHAQLPPETGGNQASIKVTTVLNADGTRTDTQKDLDARTAETTTYDKQHKIIRRMVFSLDEKGLPVEGAVFDGKGKVTSQVSMRYDAMGRLNEQIEKDGAGIVKRRTVVVRDPSGKVTSLTVYDGQGRVISQENGTAAPQVRTKKK